MALDPPRAPFRNRLRPGAFVPTALTRSAAVGILATGVDMGVLTALVEGARFRPAAANVPALLVGVGVQYVGNKFWAFGDRSPDHLRQGALFLLVEILALCLNAAGFHVAVTVGAVPYWLARPLVTFLVYLGFSFPLWTRIFRREESRAAPHGGAARREGRLRAGGGRLSPKSRRPRPGPARRRSGGAGCS